MKFKLWLEERVKRDSDLDQFVRNFIKQRGGSEREAVETLFYVLGGAKSGYVPMSGNDGSFFLLAPDKEPIGGKLPGEPMFIPENPPDKLSNWVSQAKQMWFILHNVR